MVQQLFDEQANGVKMIVASRFEETAVYQIQDPGAEKTNLHYTAVKDAQLELSFS